MVYLFIIYLFQVNRAQKIVFSLDVSTFHTSNILYMFIFNTVELFFVRFKLNYRFLFSLENVIYFKS